MLIAVALLAGVAPGASAQRIIESPGPLEEIFAGSDLRCQVRFASENLYSFFPGDSDASAANCGTMLHARGATLGFAGSGGWVPLDQTDVFGSGTGADPYTVTTTVANSPEAATIFVRRTDSYVVGDSHYTSEITVSNTGSTTLTADLYHVGDCNLHGSDSSFGYEAPNGGIFCSALANDPVEGVLGFVPLDSGSSYFEGTYSALVSETTSGQFPNTCACDTDSDSAAGLSWAISVPARGAVTRRLATSFSAEVDLTAPAVTVTDPAEGSFINTALPDYVGTGGIASSDSSQVDVEVFIGTGTSGEPAQTYTTFVDSSGRWIVSGDTIPLADGTYTVRASQIDRSGNVGSDTSTFTVDTTIPTASFTGGPTGPTNDPTPTFSFTADEPVAQFLCNHENEDNFTCSSPHTSRALPDGPHTFSVRAVDRAGNVSRVVDRTFTVDTNPPSLSITGGPSGPTRDNTPTFSFTGESGAALRCSIDGGSFSVCSSPHTTATLADGAHTFRVRAIDAAGNATTLSRSFTVDTTRPSVSITSGPSGPTNDTTPSFAFTAESGATTRCSVDGSSFAACTSPYTTSALADGPHDVRVRAQDAAGNIGTATRTFTVDTVAPSISITGGPSGLTNDPTPTFTFARESGAATACRIDSGSFASCTSPHTTASLANGSHIFRVRATDAAGNAATVSRTFSVDATAPGTTITAGPSGPTNDTTPTFEFTASQAGSTFQCSIDGGTFASCSTPHTTAALPEGSHVFRVRATDPAGNTDGTPASRSFTVDITRPAVSITGGPTGPTSDSTPTFSFTAESGSTTRCSVDGGTFAACTSPHTTAALADGNHEFRVRATDAAGNIGTATRTFSVDATAPTVTITGGPSGTTNDTTPTFTFSADAGSQTACSIDNGAFALCTSPHTTAPLGDGSHTIRVRAQDSVGNGTIASRSFSVDATAPNTTITGGPDGVTADPTPTFTFTSSQSPSTFRCSIDGGGYSACTSPHTVGALAPGSHTFRVRATDAAGNTDASPAGRSFTVAAPTLTLSPANASLTVGQSHSVVAHVENGSGTVRFRVSGAHALSGSSATDGSGNATFSYPGTAPGDDVIGAYLDTNRNGAQDTSEPAAIARTLWAPAQQPPEDPPAGELPPDIPVADSIEELPPPDAYSSTNVEPRGRGTVFVRLPGGRGGASASQAGTPKGYIPLRQAAQLPLGTIVESTRGKVQVQSTATNSSRRTQQAEFSGGRFQMTQKALGRRSRPVTEMVLKGGTFRGCPRANARRSGAEADSSQRRRSRRSRVRRLWGRGRGRFRTRGRYSSATVRGTTWLVEDRCGGTLTRLPRRPRNSAVEVRDFGRRKTVRLRAGRSYLALPRATRRG